MQAPDEPLTVLWAISSDDHQLLYTEFGFNFFMRS
jgi:hypothetical protein